MLENTPFWTYGDMHLWVNDKPAHVYVPRENVQNTYETLQSRLSKKAQFLLGLIIYLMIL